jgi:hypothetical protein
MLSLRPTRAGWLAEINQSGRLPTAVILGFVPRTHREAGRGACVGGTGVQWASDFAARWVPAINAGMTPEGWRGRWVWRLRSRSRAGIMLNERVLPPLPSGERAGVRGLGVLHRSKRLPLTRRVPRRPLPRGERRFECTAPVERLRTICYPRHLSCPYTRSISVPNQRGRRLRGVL